MVNHRNYVVFDRQVEIYVGVSVSDSTLPYVDVHKLAIIVLLSLLFDFFSIEFSIRKMQNGWWFLRYLHHAKPNRTVHEISGICRFCIEFRFEFCAMAASKHFQCTCLQLVPYDSVANRTNSCSKWHSLQF